MLGPRIHEAAVQAQLVVFCSLACDTCTAGPHTFTSLLWDAGMLEEWNDRKCLHARTWVAKSCIVFISCEQGALWLRAACRSPTLCNSALCP